MTRSATSRGTDSDAGLLSDQGSGYVGEHGCGDSAEGSAGAAECGLVFLVVGLAANLLEELDECVGVVVFVRPQADSPASAIGQPVDEDHVDLAVARPVGATLQVGGYESVERRIHLRGTTSSRRAMRPPST